LLQAVPEFLDFPEVPARSAHLALHAAHPALEEGEPEDRRLSKHHLIGERDNRRRRASNNSELLMKCHAGMFSSSAVAAQPLCLQRRATRRWAGATA
jgi:hypothetical protein